MILAHLSIAISSGVLWYLNDILKVEVLSIMICKTMLDLLMLVSY